MLISGIPNLNLLYESELGILVSHYWNGKYVIHSELYNEVPTLNELKQAKEISNALDNGFKEHGVTELYTWAENDVQKKYNEFLGYVPTGEKVNETFVDKEYPREVFEYKKELK